MDPHRIPGPNDIGTGLGTNFDTSTLTGGPYANCHGQNPAFDNCPSMGVYYGSPYVQNHTMLRAPSIPAPLAPRVHINPNYRPKALLGLQSSTSNRPASVHINPHWKGRVESAQEGHGSHAVGKKTIFVNPKVLSQLNLQQPPYPIEARPAPSVHLNYLPSQDAPANVSSLPSDETNKSRQSTEMSGRNEVLKKTVSEPAFVVLNSRKLVRKTNAPQCNPVSSLEGSKRTLTAGSTSALKVARQVASKYKLVRNTSTAPNVLKPVKCVPAAYSRRSRRKLVNPRLSPRSNFKSVYKFIRQTEDCTEKSVKVGKKFDQLIVSPNSETLRLNTDTGKRCLKSRYRLIKAQPCHQKGHTASADGAKVKPVHSRYKLVRHGVRESKSSFSSFSLYSSPIRSKFRSCYATKPIYGRKVSRFRIVQASMAKNGTHIQMPSSTYTKSNICMSGLYKNISWQKEKVGPLSPKLCQPTIRNIKSKCQKNGMSSSKKALNRSLVNIGGVLYKSTRTTLTRTCPGKAKERILHIRGKKFVMDDKGKTIRPASSTEGGSLTSKGGKLFARVDIGGVTFTRRSDNTLVRTNTHYARNLLSLAKMRSIALLTDKLRKNNQPCLIYHRFGKCLSHTAGKCWRVHDPRNISICRRFLQGICENEKCLLSHDVGPEKMPTCRYFLEGCCVRDNCPYLHVKLSANAAICRPFLHGYCDAGDTCKKRHVFLCPEFEKDGKCSKGKYCPYPHVNSNEQKPRRKRTTIAMRLNNSCNKIQRNSKKVSEADKESTNETEKIKRYYDESSPCDTSNKAHFCPAEESDVETYEAGADNGNGTALERSKIGILPAYIPL